MAVYKSKNATTDVRSEAEAADKPQAKLWLNIFRPEGDVSLPYGLGLDIMPYLKGNSEFATNANSFLFDILALSEDLAPGEEREIPLVVKIRRVREAPEPTASSRKLSWK